MKSPPFKIFSLHRGGLADGKTIFFLIALALLLGGGFSAAQAQNPGSYGAAVNNGQNSGAEEELLDFFMEAIEGVEPSDFNVPAAPPLPPSSNAARPPAALPPEIQSFAPFVPDSSDIVAPPTGWLPLPGLPPEEQAGGGEQAEPPVADISTAPAPMAYDPADPFNIPPVVVESQPFQPQTGSAVPLGQGRIASTLPSPFWEDLSSDAAYYPPPESAGNWIQLEVGQSDGVSSFPAAAPGRRPTSVYSVPPPPSQSGRDSGRAAGPRVSASDPRISAVDRAMDHAIQEPTGSTETLEPAERENLRKLFSDILPPSAQGRTAAAGAPPGSGQPAAVKPAPETKSGASVPPAGVGPSAISKAGRLLSEPPAQAAAEVADRRPEPKQKSAPAPSVAGSLDEIPVKSVGTAGGSPAAGKPAEAAKAAPAKPAPVKTTAKAAVKSSPSAAAKPASAPAKSSFSLIVVNETGRARVAQQYGSVLKRLGYNVSSEVEGKAGQGPAGQTIVSYRPGFKSQAQSVSRYLPGKKTLLEAKTNQALASEIMIYIK